MICDPLVSDFFKKDLPFKFVQLEELNKNIFYRSIGAILILTNHDIFNYNKILESGKFIIDCTNSYKKNNKKIIKIN